MRILKIFKKDFMFFDKSFGNTIETRLVPVGFRLFRWNRYSWKLVAEKEWDPSEPVPDGWDPAIDFDLVFQGQTYRMTIHSSTVWRDLLPYTRDIAQEGKNIENVITRMTITSRRKINPSVRFEMVRDA
ncbi:hypothetical protein [Maridesulfovibrio sp.]|uniref:hypothetical protein n=1 Tax=Maridesulfovibrio sp. TaxID=2795000 RepID=UPI0029CA79BA|nr:hypothetical protein [Maridesulfovibrio sp.]